MQSSYRRFIELDSLPGLAAMTVVFVHFLNVYSQAPWYEHLVHSPLRTLLLAHEAVTLFFVLSGFVLSIPFTKVEATNFPIYLTKRVCRIYLPYLAAVGIAVLACSFLYSSVPTGNEWIDHTWNQKPNAWLIFQHILMIGHFDATQYNTALWTLVIEMRISLIFPLLYLLTKTFRTALLLPATVMITLAVDAASARFGQEGLAATVYCSGLFLLGIICYKHLHIFGTWTRSLKVSTKVALFLVAIILFVTPEIFTISALDHWHFLEMGTVDWVSALGVGMMLVFAIEFDAFRHFLHLAAIVRIGTISYSIYLLHGTVLFILIRLFLGKPYFGWLFPVYLLVTYLASEVLYRFVEKPGIELGRVLVKRLAMTD